MKRLIYSFALLMLTAMPASAQEDSIRAKKAPIETVSTSAAPSTPILMATAPDLADEPMQLDVHYISKNAKGENVTLSARVYIPEPQIWPDKLISVKHVILNCHPTVTSNFEAPTGSGPIDKDIYRMCGVHDYTGPFGCYMIVCPDYCGYGVSSYQQHPYLIHDVTARNCIEAVYAAVVDVMKNDKFYLNPDWDLDIVGYSQGGATALACTKYIQESGNYPELKERLRQTVCGDGPYSSVATMKQYIEWGIPAEYGGPDKDLEYPCALPLIVQAAKEAYGDGCMKTVKTEDYFKQEFLNTGIIEMLKTKVTNTDDLNNEIKKKMSRCRPVDLFSDRIINPNGTFNTTTNEYKCLIRALEKGELTTGWEPEKDLTFYHLPNDGVVPYANFEAAKEGFGKDNPNIRYLEAYEAHKGGATFWLITKYQGIGDPNFEITNHADGGTLFYVDYLFGSVLRKE